MPFEASEIKKKRGVKLSRRIQVSYNEYKSCCPEYESDRAKRDDNGRRRYPKYGPYRPKKDDDCRVHYPKYEPDRSKKDDECDIQTHNHEFAGSVMIAGSIPHTHRFAGVSSQEIPDGDSHVHAILVNTDFFFNHYHEIGIKTGPAIYIKGGKHIHYAKGETTVNFGHDHDFIFTTFIEDPLQE